MSFILPASIRADAKPLTFYEFAALMLDELEQMAHEGDAIEEVPPEAGLHLGWWSSLAEGQREHWRCWLTRNIQADDLQPLLRE